MRGEGSRSITCQGDNGHFEQLLLLSDLVLQTKAEEFVILSVASYYIRSQS